MFTIKNIQYTLNLNNDWRPQNLGMFRTRTVKHDAHCRAHAASRRLVGRTTGPQVGLRFVGSIMESMGGTTPLTSDQHFRGWTLWPVVSSLLTDQAVLMVATIDHRMVPRWTTICHGSIRDCRSTADPATGPAGYRYRLSHQPFSSPATWKPVEQPTGKPTNKPTS